jgi:hypothetical protein
MLDVQRVGKFVGDYQVVALTSARDTAFTGTLTLTRGADTALSASGNLSHWGSVHGEGFVHGDTLHVVVWPQVSISVGFSGTLASSTLVGIWTYGADGCWHTPCPAGTFTARRS